MSGLDNCSRCGQIFVKALRSFCEKCVKEYEQMFDTVYSYVRKRENRQASLQEVIKATGVDEQYIFRFIREGRLKVQQFPNLSYPCESCGEMTRNGRICLNCKGKISRDLKSLDAEMEVRKRQKLENQGKFSTYKTFNN